MSQQPSVGRVVHYRSYGTPGGEYAPECRAAIITEVATDDDLGITDAHRADPETREGLPVRVVGLAVVNTTGLFFRSVADGGCEYDEDAERGGTWHWPERVPDERMTLVSDQHGNARGVPAGTIPRPDRTPGPDVP